MSLTLNRKKLLRNDHHPLDGQFSSWSDSDGEALLALENNVGLQFVVLLGDVSVNAVVSENGRQ